MDKAKECSRQSYLDYNLKGAVWCVAEAMRYDDSTMARDAIGQALNHLTKVVEDIDGCTYKITKKRAAKAA